MPRRLLALLIFAAAFSLAACGDESSPATDDKAAAERPVGPGRVVALDPFVVPELLALGVTPAGVTGGQGGLDDIRASFERLAGTRFADAGDGFQISVEKVASTRPDVIVLGANGAADRVVPRLRKIAKVIVLPAASDYKERTRTLARQLGLTPVAERAIVAAEQDLARLRTEMAEAGLAGRTASVVGLGFFDPAAGIAYHESGLPGRVISGAGLRQPDAQAAGARRVRERGTASAQVSFSTEDLRDHDGDVLFRITAAVADPSRFEASPLYKRLRAVRSRAVYDVDTFFWLTPSPAAIRWIADDLRASLLRRGSLGTLEGGRARLQRYVAGT